MLQARFAIISRPARLWKNKDLDVVMKACIIMHNMIVEDERDESNLSNNYDRTHSANPSTAVISRDPSHYSFKSFLNRYGNIMDPSEHFRLKSALVAHLWHIKGYGNA